MQITKSWRSDPHADFLKPRGAVFSIYFASLALFCSQDPVSSYLHCVDVADIKIKGDPLTFINTDYCAQTPEEQRLLSRGVERAPSPSSLGLLNGHEKAAQA